MRIYSNTLVKNEERYIWYALSSVVEYMDKMIIWDTGSTDSTFEIIKEFQKKFPAKVVAKQIVANTPDEVRALRQKMLEETISDWVFILDGDEVWWNDSIKKVIETVRNNRRNWEIDSIVVPFINLIGDIYHYQDKSSGRYTIDGKKGFLTIRLLNRKIPGLHVDKPYPLEGYYDQNNVLIQDLPSTRRLYLDLPYLHFSHLVRSVDLNTDKKAVARTNKNKIELGKSFPLDYYYPEVFFLARPKIVPSPWVSMSFGYYAKALFIKPFRKIKQWIK